MASERFDRALRQLRSASLELDRAARAPENLDELRDLRTELERTRTNMKIIRWADYGRPKDPPTPDFVDPTIGMGQSSRFGTVMGLLAIVVMVVGVIVVTTTVARIGDAPLTIVSGSLTQTFEPIGPIETAQPIELTHPIASGEPIESSTATCRWRASFLLRNRSDDVIRVRSAAVLLDDPSRPIDQASPSDWPVSLDPGQMMPVEVSAATARCPAGPALEPSPGVRVSFVFEGDVDRFETLDLEL